MAAEVKKRNRVSSTVQLLLSMQPDDSCTIEDLDGAAISTIRASITRHHLATKARFITNKHGSSLVIRRVQ